MKVQLDCKEVSRLLSDGLDADLPPGERTRLRLHLVICENCRDVNEQMNFLRQAMRRLGQEEAAAEPRAKP